MVIENKSSGNQVLTIIGTLAIISILAVVVVLVLMFNNREGCVMPTNSTGRFVFPIKSKYEHGDQMLVGCEVGYRGSNEASLITECVDGEFVPTLDLQCTQMGVDCPMMQVQHANEMPAVLYHSQSINLGCKEGYFPNEGLVASRKCESGQVVPSMEQEPLVCTQETHCYVGKLPGTTMHGTEQVRGFTETFLVKNGNAMEYRCEVGSTGQQGTVFVRTCVMGELSPSLADQPIVCVADNQARPVM